jgi:hypothetical protein
MSDRSSILQGTLDLMVLKTLDAMGPMHGYGLARRIEQISEEAPPLPPTRISQAAIASSCLAIVCGRLSSVATLRSSAHRSVSMAGATRSSV